MANLNDFLETGSCRYGTMSFFRNDNTISRSLKECGEWAQNEIDFLSLLIKPTDTVLDVGAFIGTHTLAFSQKVGAAGKVYAFEPQPFFLEVLKINIEQNALTNVSAFHAALSDNCGRAELAEIDLGNASNFGHSSILASGPASGVPTRPRVEVMTIDQLALHRCDLIKIDTESMEINVLRGARKTVRAMRPFVFAECNSLEDGWPVAELLKHERYRIYVLNVAAYNLDTFRHDVDNFFESRRETGLVLIPEEKLPLIQDQLDSGRCPSLVPISSIDDLALALLKKPQYKYEVMLGTAAASVLGVDFWANETELRRWRGTIQQQQGVLARRDEELACLQGTLAPKENELGKLQGILALKEKELGRLQGTLALREGELASLNEEHRALRKELNTHEKSLAILTQQLNQIYASHGWRALSSYHRFRDSLLPDNSQRRKFVGLPRAAFALLSDMRLVRKSGLFNREWYLCQYPEVAKVGVDPLKHYLRHGATEGRDPNPLFDSDWYLQQNPDVLNAGLNPLIHYVRHGALEGRDPSPLFDSTRYLQEHPDAKADMSPLSHYLCLNPASVTSSQTNYPQHSEPATKWVDRVCGDKTDPALPRPREKQTTFPQDSKIAMPNAVLQVSQLNVVTQTEKRPRLKLNRIQNPVVRTYSQTNGRARRLICVSHVLPLPSRAGNEYRIHRMLSWHMRRGFEIFLIVCPLPGEVVTTPHFMSSCSVYSNLILCGRDGTLSYSLTDGGGCIGGLAGIRPRNFGRLLKEDTVPGAANIFATVRTFCPDLLAEVMLRLDGIVRPDIFLANYVFMTRAFPLLRSEVLKVVDTHDVFSTKRDKVIRYGIEDGSAMSAAEEARLLEQADLVIAIHPEEAATLQRLVPKKSVITVPADFDSIDSTPPPARDPVILLVASANSLNVRGLRDFLRFAWPLVRREVPGAELRVVGSVATHLEIDRPGVKIVGAVDDLDAVYAQARVVVNPAVAGTGLKIKTAEALCHLRPIVVWPSGVDGLDAEMRALCYIAGDWYSFAQGVVELCKTERVAKALLANKDRIRQAFSADTAYQALDRVFGGLQM